MDKFKRKDTRDSADRLNEILSRMTKSIDSVRRKINPIEVTTISWPIFMSIAIGGWALIEWGIYIFQGVMK